MSRREPLRSKRGRGDINRTAVAVTPPKYDSGVYVWKLEEIKNARNAQMKGDFELPARLAEAFKTDDAMFVASNNRLAPAECLSVQFAPSEFTDLHLCVSNDQIKAEAVQQFGPKGTGLPKNVLTDIRHDRVHNAVGIGHIVQRHRDRGQRVDFYLEHWPIKHCRWDDTKGCLVTRVEGGPEREIHHGDGEWVVFQKHSNEPWKKDAAVLPGALVWAAHAFAANDWAKGSRSHGNAKVVGEMPEGYDIEDENGLTRSALQLLALLGAVANDDAPSGIKPFGSKLEYIVNSSTAWQVWQALMENREKAAARIFLGTDGVLGATGGAPGVDIAALFGVATTIVQGDLLCEETALATGFFGPWAALNFGDSRSAPSRAYQLPDADLESVQNSYADRDKKFQDTIKIAKENGFLVDQVFINKAAEKYGVEPPTLAVSAPSGADFYAYELDGGVVTIDEVRARKGLPPLPNGAGAMTVPQAQAMAAGTMPATAPAPVAATEGAETAEASPSSAQLLADKMTASAVKRCEHGSVNRCNKCGVERDRDFDLDANGDPIWTIAWKPIGAPNPSQAPAIAA